MNKKAELFNAMLEENKIEAFKSEEMQDEFHTVLYHSNMEVSGQYLPLALLLDDSLYSMLRIWVAQKVVTDTNRAQLEACFNRMNQHYKIFKYYATEEGDIVLDCCIPSADEHFDSRLVRTVIDVVLKHLQEEYAEIMKVVWSKE